MKKVMSLILSVTLLATVFFSLTGCSQKKKWYLDALEYYSGGTKSGFMYESRQLTVPAELKNKQLKCGYLLHDLDGDGVEELLIGLIDDAPYTKFTNVIVNHSDLGAYCLLSGTNGYYIYLCSQDVLRVDTYGGLEAEKKYMKFESRRNAFAQVDGEGKYLPQKWDLKAF